MPEVQAGAYVNGFPPKLNLNYTLGFVVDVAVAVAMPEVQAGGYGEGSEAPLMTDEPDLSTFENKSGLAEDMKFLASMPELCDVTFLVGETREPVCAVKAVLAARSRSVQLI